jgi:hypothetical protein
MQKETIMQATAKMLSQSSATVLASALKSQDKNDQIWVKASDAVRADGITSAMLETEKKGGSEALRNQIKGIIVSTFTEAEKALLSADSKALDDVKKMLKKTAQQKIGARLSLIQSHIRKAEKAEEDGEAQSPKTEIQRIHEALDKVIGKMQKMDAPSFDTTECIKRIKSVKGMMPAL